MRGEWAPVWRDVWREVWSPLSRHPDAPEDIFVELFRELAAGFRSPLTPERLADAISSPERARRAFRSAKAAALPNEQALLAFLERAHGVADDLGGDALSNRYYALVDAFIGKFSLRYDLRRPFTLHPTLSGVFSGMMRELKALAQRDADLQPIFHEFEEALRDLTASSSERVIKTCIQKQVNLLEALGQKSPGVTAQTLGQICNQLGVWPHASVSEAIKNLYRFSCDYPGIRHAGTPGNRIRNIEMKDMVAVSVLLAGFTPYLSHQLDAEVIYRGCG